MDNDTLNQANYSMPGIDDTSNNDAEKGATIGGIGGAAVGAIAGSVLGPGGALLGGIIGGAAGAVASGAAVAAIDEGDGDNSTIDGTPLTRNRGEKTADTLAGGCMDGKTRKRIE